MIKYILIILIFSLKSFGQLQGQKKIDSLESAAIDAKQDTNYVKLVNQLSFAYYPINPDKGIAYGKESAKIAKKLNYKNGIASAYNAIGVNYAAGKADYIKAREMYQKSLEIYEEINNERGIGSAYNNIALVYQIERDFDNAIKYFESSIELAQKTGNQKGEAGGINNIGNIYSSLNDYSLALEYFQKSLKIYREINDKSGISFCLNNIAMIYIELDENKKALDYYKQVLDIQKKIDDFRGIANTKSNIASLLIKEGEFKHAEEYLNAALEYFQSSDNEESISNVYTHYGLLYKKQIDYDKAMEYFTKVLELRKNETNRVRYASALANIGSIYYSKMIENNKEKINEITNSVNLKQAISYLEEAVRIYEEEGEILSRAAFSRDLSKAYERLGDKGKALTYFKNFHTLQDSIFNKNKTIELTNLIRKQEREERLFEEQLAAKKVARRNQIQYAAITIITIFAFAIIFYLTRTNVSIGIIDTLIFVAFLLLYEFILVVTEPWVDDFTNEVPIYKLLINIGIALILIPLQKLENKIKDRAINKG